MILGASDKDEYGVDKLDIFTVDKENEYEDDGERQDTTPAESDKEFTLQLIKDTVSAEL